MLRSCPYSLWHGVARAGLGRAWRWLGPALGCLCVLMAHGAPPAFKTVPAARQVVSLAESLVLAVEAQDETGVSYQWKRNGRIIPDADSASYAITAARPQDAGWYQVAATNGSGTALSAPIFVNVAVALPEIRDLPLSESLQLPTMAPAALEGVTGVAAGARHALALKSDGTVVAWGSNDRGESSVPAGLSEVVAIAASGQQSMALRADGTVVAWGDDDDGQAGIPGGLGNVVAITAGGRYGLALHADGGVTAWGLGGMAGVPGVLTDVVSVATGGGAWSVALRADGTATWWSVPFPSAFVTGLSRVAGIAAGSTFGLALEAGGTVSDWPLGPVDSYGKVGDVPAGLADVVALAAAGDASLAIRADGTVAAWEMYYVSYGGPIVVPPGSGDAWSEIRRTGEVVMGAIGTGHVVLVRDASRDAPPVILAGPVNQEVFAGGKAMLSVTASGTPVPTYQWSRNGTPIPSATGSTLTLQDLGADSAGTYTVTVTNGRGQASAAATLNVFVPPVITQHPAARQVVNLGESLSLAVEARSSDRPAYQWRRNGLPIPGAAGPIFSVAQATMQDGGWYQVAVTNSVGTTTSTVSFVNVAAHPARLVIWGDGDPRAAVTGVTDAVAVAAGYLESYVLRADGSVTASPGGTVPEGLRDVVAIATGSRHTVALKSDGTVVAWGLPAPQVPAGLKDVVRIEVFGSLALAVRADGSVVTWGDNSIGILPANLRHVVSIAAGSSHYLALTADGSMLARQWISPPRTDVGTVPGALTEVVEIAAGSGHNVVLTRRGTVDVWGENSRGECAVPPGLVEVVAVDAAARYSLAVRRDGTVASWGEGGWGQTELPGDLRRVVGVSAGVFHCIAIVDATEGAAPAILGQPAAQTVAPGGVATFSVVTAGTGTGQSYQWFRAGTPVPGANAATLIVTDAGAAVAGEYSVRVSNASGAVESQPAALVVDAAANPSRLVNLSVRSPARVGAETLIVGFVVEGTGTTVRSPVLIRGVGPSLAEHGVASFVPDPTLRLFRGSEAMSANDNWNGDGQVNRIGAEVGAFPLNATVSLDAALLTQLKPGGYTAHITAHDGGTGAVLGELYDATTSGTESSVIPRLANVSARAHVDAQAPLIAGFVIAGATPQPVLLRAVGPTLNQFGVENPLANPALHLFSGAVQIDGNDDWQPSEDVLAATSRTGAFPLVANSQDALLLATLPPGAYTVHVVAAGDAGGVALVEVYDAR